MSFVGFGGFDRFGGFDKFVRLRDGAGMHVNLTNPSNLHFEPFSGR